MENDETNTFPQSLNCSLLSALNFNPSLFRKNDASWELQFTVYQIFRLFQELAAHDKINEKTSLTLKNLIISESHWLSLDDDFQRELFGAGKLLSADAGSQSETGFFKGTASYDTISHLITKDFQEVCSEWLFGTVSNFEYILYLNFMAGRDWNDTNYYPIMPWVVDFSDQHGGFVDLTKTKFRQTKGDPALDSTFTLISSGATPPHHIPSLLTDLTYYLYKARRLEKELLCKHVRKRWVPSEYPSSMKRMQEWSPEECIPDFYCDPMIFQSIHDDLPDIALPQWCSNPNQFLDYHRQILESDEVSRKIHEWIDLVFGHKLTGQAAVDEKNVHLFLVDTAGKVSHRSGIVQLFSKPHPPRFQSVAFLRSEFGNPNFNPVAILDFTEKLDSFFTNISFHPNFLKFQRDSLNSKWDCQKTKQTLQNIAILVVEIALYQHASAEISAAITFKSRFDISKMLFLKFKDELTNLIHPFKQFLNEIFDDDDEDSYNNRICLHRLKLSESIDAVLYEGIHFPIYFESLYNTLISVYSLRRLDDAQPADFVKAVLSFLAEYVSDIPYDIGPSLFRLFSSLFKWPETRDLCVFCLLPHFGTLLGRENCCKLMLKPLTTVLSNLTNNTASPNRDNKQHFLKFFNKDFNIKIVNLFGLQTYLEHMVPFIIRGAIFTSEGVEIGTLSWVIDFAGPVNAVRFVTPLIFSSISDCYDELDDSFDESTEVSCRECPIPSLHCNGDERVERLGTVLESAACTFGDFIITGHFITAMSDIIQQTSSTQAGQLTNESESGLIGCLYIMRQIIFIMPTALVNSVVQERLARLLNQVLTLITSLHVVFPRAPRTRYLAFCRYLDVLYAIGLRLGKRNTEVLLEPLLRLTLIKLSVNFRVDDNEDNEQQQKIEQSQRLPPDCLNLAFSILSRIASRFFIDSITPNDPSIPKLQVSDSPDLVTGSSRDRQLFSLGSSFAAGSNRLSQQEQSPGSPSLQKGRSLDTALGEIDNSYKLYATKTRHLGNQWAALWTQRLAAPRDLSFKGLHLQAFSGNQMAQTKGSVHQLLVSHATEQFAVSVSTGPSKERAIAIWSLESRSDTSAPVLLYSEHQRRCIGLTLVEAHRQVLSVDTSTLHLWDSASGAPVSMISCQNAVASLPTSTYSSSFSSPNWSAVAPMGDSEQLAIASTNFGLIFVIDPRLPSTIATAMRVSILISMHTK